MMIFVILEKNKTGKHAFTFIELLLVIAIIGILTAVAIPQFKKVADNYALESFVKDIYYLARYLQASASMQGRLYYLNINQEEGRLWATYKKEDRTEKAEGRFGNVYSLPRQATISTSGPGEIEKKEILFYPDGSIDEVALNFQNRQNQKFSLVIKGVLGDIKIQ